jgi:hypothetical protein
VGEVSGDQPRGTPSGLGSPTSIRWISSRTGAFDPGVVGGFIGARGELYGQDEGRGESPLRSEHARPRPGAMEQVFSYDDAA